MSDSMTEIKKSSVTFLCRILFHNIFLNNVAAFDQMDQSIFITCIYHINIFFKPFKEFLKKVPIIDSFSEENNDNKEYYNNDIDDEILEEYIKNNTYNGRIRLLRRYYAIIAKK